MCTVFRNHLQFPLHLNVGVLRPRGHLSSAGSCHQGAREAAMAEADVEPGHRESGASRDSLSGLRESLRKQPCF